MAARFIGGFIYWSTIFRAFIAMMTCYDRSYGFFHFLQALRTYMMLLIFSGSRTPRIFLLIGLYHLHKAYTDQPVISGRYYVQEGRCLFLGPRGGSLSIQWGGSLFILRVRFLILREADAYYNPGRTLVFQAPRGGCLFLMSMQWTFILPHEADSCGLHLLEKEGSSFDPRGRDLLLYSTRWTPIYYVSGVNPCFHVWRDGCLFVTPLNE